MARVIVTDKLRSYGVARRHLRCRARTKPISLTVTEKRYPMLALFARINGHSMAATEHRLASSVRNRGNAAVLSFFCRTFCRFGPATSTRRRLARNETGRHAISAISKLHGYESSPLDLCALHAQLIRRSRRDRVRRSDPATIPLATDRSALGRSLARGPVWRSSSRNPPGELVVLKDAEDVRHARQPSVTSA